MSGLHLIADIAGQRVAIPTDSVESVVEIETIAPVPTAPPHIAGLSALRSRVITMIDSYAAIGIPNPPSPSCWQAIVVVVDGHLYGLIVDRVDDVANLASEPQALRGALAPGWARVSRGVVDHEGDTVLVIDPAMLVAGPTAALAA